MARLSFRCSDELAADVDLVRGREPREAWLRRMVDRAVEVGAAERHVSLPRWAAEGQPQGLSSEQSGFVEAIERGARSAKKPKATVPPPKPPGSSPAASRGSTDPFPNRPLSRTEAFRRATQGKRSS